MSLESAMEKLANALNRYADVIEANGVGVVSQAKKASPSDEEEEDEKPKGSKVKKDAKADKGGKAKKAARDEEDEEEDDRPAKKRSRDEDEEDEDEKPKGKKLTLDDVKEKLFEVRDEVGKKDAKAILDKFGYDVVGDVEAKDFEKVIAACEKALK